MKRELRTILKLCFACCLPLFSFAQYENNKQYQYHDWVKNVERDTVQSIETWRITLQKRLTKIDSLLMDSLVIENQDGSISVTEKYRLQNTDTIVRGNDTLLRERLLPLRKGLEFPDTTLLRKKVFNEQGLLVFSEGFFSGVDWPKYLYKSFKYDERDRLIEQIEMDADSNFHYVYTYRYNDRKKTVRQNQLIDDELAQYGIWKYDKSGNLQSMSIYWAKGKELQIRSEYEHRKEGHLIIRKRFDDKGNHEFTVYKKIDSDNNELESVMYSADSTFEHGSYYAYDDNGNLTTEKKVESKGEKREVREHYEYSYIKNKLMQVERVEEDGIKSVVEKYYYNIDGLLESSIVFNDEGVPVTKYDYKYDKRK